MEKKQYPDRKPLTPNHAEEIDPDSDKVTSKVKIKAPTQTDDKEVRYTVGQKVDIRSLADPDGFYPGRFIANIILDKDASIDPPVTLSIEITQEDVNRANGRKFKLGYHNGTKWIRMKENIDSQTGTVDVELSKLGDPPIAVSP